MARMARSQSAIATVSAEPEASPTSAAARKSASAPASSTGQQVCDPTHQNAVALQGLALGTARAPTPASVASRSVPCANIVARTMARSATEGVTPSASIGPPSTITGPPSSGSAARDPSLRLERIPHEGQHARPQRRDRRVRLDQVTLVEPGQPLPHGAETPMIVSRQQDGGQEPSGSIGVARLLRVVERVLGQAVLLAPVRGAAKESTAIPGSRRSSSSRSISRNRWW